MARYLDSGTGTEGQCLGDWFAANMADDLRAFRCQFGYFGYDAIIDFESAIRSIAANGLPVHIVLGANKRALYSDDLTDVLGLFTPSDTTSLTVVTFRNAEFHPKVVQIERPDGALAAVVGSSNLTPAGMGRNVEAGVVLDTRDGDDAAALSEIAAAIERWHSLEDDAVFQIQGIADIDALIAARVISEPTARTGSGDGSGTSDGTAGGLRTPIWRPSRRRRRQRPAAPSGEAIVTAPEEVAETPETAQVVSVQRCCKKMSATDALQNAGHIIGNIRLTKARHDIDFLTFFRTILFDNAHWTQSTDINGNAVESAQVGFDVRINGSHLGHRTLEVSHAPHRESGQKNHASVLYWGTEIRKLLRKTSYVGHWIVIARSEGGRFTLTVQPDEPDWAP